MKKEVIIFDKDGTLVDFDSFWVTVTMFALGSIKARFGAEDIADSEFLDALGVVDGSADTDSILCVGSFYDMGVCINEVFRRHGLKPKVEDVTEVVTKEYEKNMENAIVKGTAPNLKNTIETLHKKGKRLIVATADNSKITSFCLKKLGIQGFFEKIYTSDCGYMPKPDPECIDAYCSETLISKDKLVMIGDTMNDIALARNAGIDVIILKSKGKSSKELEEKADMMIESITELEDIF